MSWNSEAQGKGPRGFTLVELMVVVAVISIVTAAVVPSFKTTLKENRQREAGLLVFQSVLTARSGAARTGHCFRVRVETGTPGQAGGNGGSVAVDEGNRASCVQMAGAVVCAVWPPVLPDACWHRVSFKSVSENNAAGDAVFADATTGQVGEDVAIDAVFNAAGAPLAIPDPGWMMFDGAGGVSDRTERNFRIRMYELDGTVLGAGGPNDPFVRYVGVQAGGITRMLVNTNW